MAAAEHEHHGHVHHDDQTPHEKAVLASSALRADGNGQLYHETE
jgi:hypothetical protein